MSADAAGSAAARRSWALALDAAEEVVAAVRAALEGRAPFSGADPVEFPSEPLPPELATRVRLLLGGHADVEVALRERIAMLGAAIHRDPVASRAVIALYLDRSA